MKNVEFFVLEYEWLPHGLPPFISGTFNHAEFEWDLLDRNSLREAHITKSYEFRISTPEVAQLDFDLYDPRSPIVSDAFLSLCEELAVGYRSVPLPISLANGKRVEKGFHLFLPYQAAALLDRHTSEFGEEVVVDTGEVMMDKHFPEHPVYSWIRKFTVAPTRLHLFHCIELMQLVVSRRFVALSEERGLKGLRFVPLDDHFRHDPWGEIEE